MENRIRVGVLVFESERMLLVKHVDPRTGYTWWVTPGGRLKGSETIFECAERETKEETSMKVKAGRIAYLRQFIYRQFGANSIEIFLTCEGFEGSPSTANLKGKGADELYIKEVGFFSQREIAGMNVLPRELTKVVWRDHDEGFPTIRFLGIEYDEGP